MWVLSGLGRIIVGLVPENTNIDVHLLGALSVPLCSVAILLSTGGEFAGSSAYLGLGVGGAERLASYPGSLWMLVLGVIAMIGGRTWQGSRNGAWQA